MLSHHVGSSRYAERLSDLAASEPLYEECWPDRRPTAQRHRPQRRRGDGDQVGSDAAVAERPPRPAVPRPPADARRLSAATTPAVDHLELLAAAASRTCLHVGHPPGGSAATRRSPTTWPAATGSAARRRGLRHLRAAPMRRSHRHLPGASRRSPSRPGTPGNTCSTCSGFAAGMGRAVHRSAGRRGGAGDPRVRYMSDAFRDAGLDGAWTIGLDDGSHIGVGASRDARPCPQRRPAAERDGLLRRPRAAGCGTTPRVPGHRPGVRADVAGTRSGRHLRRPRRPRHHRRADRPAGLQHPRLRARLDHDGAAGRAGRMAGDAAAGLAASASPASPAGAGRTARSTIDGHRTGCACTSSAGSPTCRALAPAAFELALHIHEDERDDIELLRDRGWAADRSLDGRGHARPPTGSTCRARAPS